MKRFLTLLAFAAVAGAMYVAAAPGGQQATPTAKQFAALKKQVAALSKEAKSAQKDVNLLAGVVVGCMLHQTVGVVQNGDPGGTFGYSFTDSGAHQSLTTALDLTSGTPTYTLLTLNTSDASLGCASLVGAAGAKHFSSLERLGAHH